MDGITKTVITMTTGQGTPVKQSVSAASEKGPLLVMVLCRHVLLCMMESTPHSQLFHLVIEDVEDRPRGARARIAYLGLRRLHRGGCFGGGGRGVDDGGGLSSGSPKLGHHLRHHHLLFLSIVVVVVHFNFQGCRRGAMIFEEQPLFVPGRRATNLQKFQGR